MRQDRDTSKPLPSTRAVSRPVMMEPSLPTEFAKSVTSVVLPVWEVPPTVSPALPARSSIREAAGLPVPPFSSRAPELAQPPVLTTVPTVSTRLVPLPVLPVLLSVRPAATDLITVLPVNRDQLLPTELALSPVVKTSSASREFVWLVPVHAMVAPSSPPTVRLVHPDT